MKRITAILTAAGLGIFLAGCGTDDGTKDPVTPVAAIGAEQGTSAEQPSANAVGSGNAAAAQSAETENDASQTETPEPHEQPKPDGFYFELNGEYITMNEEAGQIFAKIGEPDKIFESPSCAFNGIDKKLYYDGFIIDTYPDGDSDLVLSITLTDSSVKTPEGVGIGMKFEDMVNAYGDDYDNMLDLYSYVKDGVKLSFLFEDDAVVDVSYYYMSAAN